MDYLEPLNVSQHAETCFEKLNRLQKDKSLCDITIIVGEDEFPAHRVVLVASSDYFTAMFETNMQEKYASSVELKEISSNVFSTILDFMYTGKIDLNGIHVSEILKAVTMMQIQNLLQAIDEMLVYKVNETTFVELLEISKTYSLTLLKQATKKYILSNFQKLYKQQKFLDLANEDITDFLSSDDLKPRTEDDVFHAMLKWINKDPEVRQEYFPKLFSLIRLQHVSQECLTNEIKNEELVRNNVECRDFVDDAFHFHFQPFMFKSQTNRATGINIVAVHKATVDLLNAQTEVVTPIPLHELMAIPDLHTYAVAVRENDVYFCGGCKGTNQTSVALKSTFRYNGTEWFRGNELKFPRFKAAAIFWKDEVYIFGGEVGNLNFVAQTERTNAKDNVAVPGMDLRKARSCASIVIFEGIIYILGGKILSTGTNNLISAANTASIEAFNGKK